MKFNEFYELTKKSVEENFNNVYEWFEKDKELMEYKPNNGGWSINEILEHIALTNHYLLILVDKGKNKSLRKDEKANVGEIEYSEDHLEVLFEIGKHGSFSWIRPEHMEPTGNVSLGEIKEKLEKQLEECKNVLEILKNGEGTLIKTMMSVNGLGKIDVYEYIYFIAMHSKRHIGQMSKVELEYKNKK